MLDVRYHRPATLQEAGRLFGAASDPQYLAGGHSLIPAMKLGLRRPSDLIDLCALTHLRSVRTEDRYLIVGGGTCHAAVASSPVVRSTLPALADLAAGIGDRQVRNRGTLGGSIANNDPASDYPAAVLALRSVVVTDRRRIGGDQFFKGTFETALELGEIVVEVRFAIPRRAAYLKFPHLASRFAVVGVMVAEFGSAETRVAVSGAGQCAFRLPSYEAVLASEFRPDVLSGLSVDPAELTGDHHASSEYRANLINVLARRAVQSAVAHSRCAANTSGSSAPCDARAFQPASR